VRGPDDAFRGVLLCVCVCVRALVRVRARACACVCARALLCDLENSKRFGLGPSWAVVPENRKELLLKLGCNN
jgi:hypothetical protein